MTVQAPQSLRERQKEDRKARIIAAAKSLFAQSGLEKVTIEAIADIAGVSGVTVHNYYGTKSGILLAIVAESDRELLARLEAEFDGNTAPLADLLCDYFKIICDHTRTHLDKAIWRQVISASVNVAEPRFFKLYHELDTRIASVLIRKIESMIAAGRLPDTVVSNHLGWALFNLQNTRFIDYISADDPSFAPQLQYLRNDLAALMVPGVLGR